MIDFFTPTRLHRSVGQLLNGKVMGRTIEPEPRYDVLLQDGVTVAKNLSADDFVITGEPERPQHIIAWESNNGR